MGLSFPRVEVGLVATPCEQFLLHERGTQVMELWQNTALIIMTGKMFFSFFSFAAVFLCCFYLLLLLLCSVTLMMVPFPLYAAHQGSSTCSLQAYFPESTLLKVRLEQLSISCLDSCLVVFPTTVSYFTAV